VPEYFDLDEVKYFRIWSQQLFKEFKNICWDYRINLSTPAFEIIRNKKVMGAWLPDSRTIQISSSLIYGYTWQSVLNVLKHEMAHQICSDLFHLPMAGHGADFKRACSMIGVPPEYRGASGDLHGNIAISEAGSVLTSHGRKFIDKVEKLLALAKSDNENEAVLAMQKANELIEKYNLGQITDSERSPYTYIIINPGKKKLQKFQRRICAILRDFFYVKIVYSYLYDPWQDCYNKTIELLGTVENVTIAEYCYHFLDNKLAALWRQNKGKYSGNGLRARNSYYLGALQGFYSKLHGQKRGDVISESIVLDTKALRVQNMLEVERLKLGNYVAQRFPRLGGYKDTASTVYSDSFNDGIQAGKEIKLHKGVAAHDGNMGRLLSK